MKLSHRIISIAVCLSLTACQTPLYRAVQREDIAAVQRELAKGGDPEAKTPASNLWWQLPLTPVTVSLDIAWIILIGMTGGPSKNQELKLLTRALYSYGGDTAADIAVSKPQIAYLLAASGKTENSATQAAGLKYALDKNDYAAADRLLSVGVRPIADHLLEAIKAGDATKARWLVNAGLSVNDQLYQNSYQFIAEQAGQLPLYRSLGGIVVAQPNAPLVDCDGCGGSGKVPPFDIRCSSCDGSGNKPGSRRVVGTSTHFKEWLPGPGMNARYEVRKYVTYDKCRNCGGSGRVARACSKCSGSGKISRYELDNN